MMLGYNWGAGGPHPARFTARFLMGLTLFSLSQFSRASPPIGTEVSPRAFANLMSALYEPFHSVSFVYEGEQSYQGVALRDVGTRRTAAPRTVFQGVYAYKHHGSVFLDVFSEPLGSEAALVHETLALSKDGRLEKNRSLPDRHGVNGQPRVVPGGSVWSIFSRYSPEDFFVLSRMSQYIEHLDRCDYEYIGWEEIDGHRCLHVRLLAIPGAGEGPGPHYHKSYWLDCDRGGHPLRVELERGGDVLWRIADVRLEEYKDRARSYWLPVSARVEKYDWKNRIHRRPVVVTTYALVRGSVRINEEIPDELFHAERVNGISPIYEALGLARVDNPLTLDETAAALAAQAPDPSERAVGPAGVAERLDRMLEEAERQAELLEASSPARPAQVATRWTSIGLVAFGFVVIAAAVAWKWRTT